MGIEEKLRNYLLLPHHTDGGPKAKGFLRMLGIDLAGAEYLEHQIRLGIEEHPISEVRASKPGAISCAVEFQIAGIGRYSQRRAWVKTAWEVDGPDARPRFITAIPRGRRRRR